jgi:sugar O-acyltransferase (sialic acid O-acetyltransferase NeuD family)
MQPMKSLGIFGTSGFARETRDIAMELGHRVTFVAATVGDTAGLEPSDDVLLESELPGANTLEYVIGIGENDVRRRIWERHRGQLRFVNLVHPAASFGWRQRERIDAATGVIVCAGVRFTSNVTVGNFTIFNLNATIGHDVIIEDFVNVSPGVNVSGNVLVREGAWIGTGAAINQGLPGSRLTVGCGTVVGSGAVVIQDCESDAIYAGVPAKKIR